MYYTSQQLNMSFGVKRSFPYLWKKNSVFSFYPFGRAAFSYSAVQQTFDINFPWLLGYIKKLAFGSSWGNYFTTGFVCTQEYQTYTDTALQGYQFTPWSSGASEFHFNTNSPSTRNPEKYLKSMFKNLV